MSDWPFTAYLPPSGQFIGTSDPCCMAGYSMSLCSQAGASATYAQNKAYYIPVQIEREFTVVRMGIFNGATVNSNVDVGIYDLAGTKLVSSGAIAQATVSVLQPLTVTSTTLTPGVYYFAFSGSGTTATLLRSGPPTELLRALGCQQQATAHPLPATATFAACTTAHLPFIWASELTTV